MQIDKYITRMLGHISAPAFIVQNEKITHVNSAAQELQINQETTLEELLGHAAREYQKLEGESLTLSSNQNAFAVERMGEFDLFVMEDTPKEAEFLAFGAAAQHLRMALMQLMNSPIEQDPCTSHAIHQLHRGVSNMSDVLYYKNAKNIIRQGAEISRFIGETMDPVITYFAKLGITVNYSPLPAPLSCSINYEMIERSLLNLIANSAQADAKNISVELTASKDILTIAVIDDGHGIDRTKNQNILSRYKEGPTITAECSGTGLGLSLVALAAHHHDGLLSTDVTKEGKTRIALSIKIETPDYTLRSNCKYYDYLGGRDHILTELSQILPTEIY